MKSLSLIVAILLVSIARADDKQKNQNEAEVAIAIAVAKQKALAAAAPRERLPVRYEVAKEESKRTGKPILLRVGKLDCSTLCGKLRSDLIISHEDRVEGLATERIYLVIPSKDKSALYKWAEWTTLPSETEVRAAAHKGQVWADGEGKVSTPVKPLRVGNVQQATTPNVGHCRCGDGKCLCLPAALCAQGKCPHPPAANKVGFAIFQPTAVCRN
jgi:hypothetical protein